MSHEDLFRAGAVLAAVVVFFSDSLVAYGKGLFARVAKPKPKPARPEGEEQPAATNEEDEALADMKTILELAARLKAKGCDAGVSLCQQLLDVMLGSSPAPQQHSAKAKK